VTILTDEEILECVLGGSVAFEGYKQYLDANPYEFHIRISGADAHKMTAHMISLNKKREEDKKPKPKQFEGGLFTSDYLGKETADAA
jgi:hypothetical protein